MKPPPPLCTDALSNGFTLHTANGTHVEHQFVVLAPDNSSSVAHSATYPIRGKPRQRAAVAAAQARTNEVIAKFVEKAAGASLYTEAL